MLCLNILTWWRHDGVKIGNAVPAVVSVQKDKYYLVTHASALLHLGKNKGNTYLKQHRFCGYYNMVYLIVAMEIQTMYDNHTSGCCIMQKKSSNICLFFQLNEITKTL